MNKVELRCKEDNTRMAQKSLQGGYTRYFCPYCNRQIIEHGLLVIKK